MRRFFSCICILSMLTLLFTSQLVANAEDSFVLTPSSPNPGDTVTADYEAANYSWFVIPESMVFDDGAGNMSINWSTFNWGDPGRTNTTVNEYVIPAESFGKYVFAAAFDANWSVLAYADVIRINGVGPLEYNKTLAVAGESIEATPSMSGIASYTWYAFTKEQVNRDYAGGVTLKAELDSTAKLSETTADITLPADSQNKYLYCEAYDAENNLVQKSEVRKIFAPLEIGDMPKEKRTVFGFENVDEGVLIGRKDSDTGPTALRRPTTGELWNPNYSTWGDMQWTEFPNNYSLQAIENAEAPEGKKVGKWTNLVGTEYPQGTDSYTNMFVNLTLEDPRNTYVVGATEFIFWVDLTNYDLGENGDTQLYRPRFTTRYYDEKGNKDFSLYGDYIPAIGAASFYFVDGEWVGNRANDFGMFALPAGYKGYVRIPLQDIVPAGWNQTTASPEMSLYGLESLVFYFYTFKGEEVLNSYALLDDFSFVGDSMETMPPTFYQTEINPKNGYLFESGLEDEKAQVSKVQGSEATLTWDKIEGFSKSYQINLYTLEDKYDETGTFVKSFKDITDTSFTLTDLNNSKLYGAQIVAYNKDGLVIGIYDLLQFTPASKDDPGKDNPGTGVTTAINTAVWGLLLSGTALYFSRRKMRRY